MPGLLWLHAQPTGLASPLHPPLSPTALLARCSDPAQKLNFFGGAPLGPEAALAAEMAEMDRANDRLVFLANVWLDVQATFDLLATLFAGGQ